MSIKIFALSLSFLSCAEKDSQFENRSHSSKIRTAFEKATTVEINKAVKNMSQESLSSFIPKMSSKSLIKTFMLLDKPNLLKFIGSIKNIHRVLCKINDAETIKMIKTRVISAAEGSA